RWGRYDGILHERCRRRLRLRFRDAGLGLGGSRSSRGGGRRPLGLVDGLRRLHQPRGTQRRGRGFRRLGRRALLATRPAAARAGGGPVGEHVAGGQSDPPLARDALDELPADDLLDGARGALHLDAVIALEQRHHLLAGGLQQFRDFVDPNSCQRLPLILPRDTARRRAPYRDSGSLVAASCSATVSPPDAISGSDCSAAPAAVSSAACALPPGSTAPASTPAPGSPAAPGSSPGQTMSGSGSGSPAAPSDRSNCASISRRFSSSLLMSIRQPVSF